MCTDSIYQLRPKNSLMEGEFRKQKNGTLYEKASILLELSASDDLPSFKNEIEMNGLDVNEASSWYGRRIGSKKMGFEKRTPLMIAAMFGSVKVLKYMIETGKVDVNKSCGSDEITALHCAVAGGASSAVNVVKILLNACADTECTDANGNKPIDLIPFGAKSMNNSRRRALELLFKGNLTITEEEELLEKSATLPEKKEYPVDILLPDINNGVYSTDEFRMYTFKVKPCSRAYSHDWTECPFAHPGENAKRRDPRKYPYSCVPCPEFRKGACPKGDTCDYAHGVFESWLHPAQYRTRLCKDEINCTRKVCFFAHRKEELRPVFACTGSAMPSPSSMSASVADVANLSPLSLGSASMSTPPMSPLANSGSSPKSGSSWQNRVNITPPALQLPGSRLKTALSARDLDMEMSMNLNLQQQLMAEMSPSISSPSRWSKDRVTFDDGFEHLDASVMLSPLRGMSLNHSMPTQMNSPTHSQIRQNSMNSLRASYPTSVGFDSSAAVAAAVMNSRTSAFAKRSQSFIDRGAATTRVPSSAGSMMMSSNLSDWGSPDGKLDWGMQGDELSKLKKSASFGFRSNNLTPGKKDSMMPSSVDEPDVSWVNSLVKDVPPMGNGSGFFRGEKQQQQQQKYNQQQQQKYNPWLEQLYIEQEQMVA